MIIIPYEMNVHKYEESYGHAGHKSNDDNDNMDEHDNQMEVQKMTIIMKK